MTTQHEYERCGCSVNVITIDKSGTTAPDIVIRDRIGVAMDCEQHQLGPQLMTALQVGDRVMGGEGEGFDVGTIHGIEGDMADVGWESGQRSPAHIEDLRPYDREEAHA